MGIGEPVDLVQAGSTAWALPVYELRLIMSTLDLCDLRMEIESGRIASVVEWGA